MRSAKRRTAGAEAAPVSPEISQWRGLRRPDRGGSIGVAAMARIHRLDRGPGTQQRHGMGCLKTLRDPIRVHGRWPGIWATGTARPWLGRLLRPSGRAAADTKQEEAVDGGSEPNKQPPMRAWEVVAPS